MLCSDGLSDALSEEEIRKITTEFKDDESIAEALVGEAYKNGGRDNITAVTIIF